MAKYTDDQINEAIMLANQTGKVYSWETEMYRNVIKHLSEPASDNWEQCTIDQIRKGDRFKVEGRGWHYESTATHIYVDVVCVNPRTGSFITRDEVDQIDEITLYRIPAPVQHPDPAEHPVIIVRESTVLPKGSEPQKVMFIRPYYRNDIWSGAPDTITDWSPAKVVATDD